MIPKRNTKDQTAKMLSLTNKQRWANYKITLFTYIHYGAGWVQGIQFWARVSSDGRGGPSNTVTRVP